MNSGIEHFVIQYSKYIMFPPLPEPWSYHAFNFLLTLKDAFFSSLNGDKYQ